MILDAGPGHRFDLTLRALVLARPASAPPAGAAGRPDLLLTRADTTAGHGPVPLVRELVGPEAVWALAAGSAPHGIVLVRPGNDVVNAATAQIFARAVADAAGRAGRDAATVVIDLGLDDAPDAADAWARLEATTRVVGLHHPVAVAVDGPAGSPVAVVVAALTAGARVLRVVPGGSDVRTVRRAADVAEALLVERAGADGPTAVTA